VISDASEYQQHYLSTKRFKITATLSQTNIHTTSKMQLLQTHLFKMTLTLHRGPKKDATYIF